MTQTHLRVVAHVLHHARLGVPDPVRASSSAPLRVLVGAELPVLGEALLVHARHQERELLGRGEELDVGLLVHVAARRAPAHVRVRAQRAVHARLRVDRQEAGAAQLLDASLGALCAAADATAS